MLPPASSVHGAVIDSLMQFTMVLNILYFLLLIQFYFGTDTSTIKTRKILLHFSTHTIIN